MVAAIRKSGQNTSDWLRQAAQTRLDQERGKDAAHGKLEKQIDGLQKEMARLQQSESIAQAALAEMRKTLAAIQQNQAAAQQNQVELRRSLDQINAGFGHAFTTLGQSLLVALGQQLDRYVQKLAAKEDETPPFVLPPIPPRTRL
jgi:predicted  nucleic acid-binding Zn-ribbon protein